MQIRKVCKKKYLKLLQTEQVCNPEKYLMMKSVSLAFMWFAQWKSRKVANQL